MLADHTGYLRVVRLLFLFPVVVNSHILTQTLTEGNNSSKQVVTVSKRKPAPWQAISQQPPQLRPAKGGTAAGTQEANMQMDGHTVSLCSASPAPR